MKYFRILFMANPKKQSKKKDADEETGEKHCICDSKDYTTLMICCDFCLVWYHVECVKVTEDEAKIIKKFACHFCTEKDPNCVTLHKKWAKGVVMSKQKGAKNGGSGKTKETSIGKEKTTGEKEAKNASERQQRRERERSGESSSSKTNPTQVETSAGGTSRKSNNKMKTDGEESEGTTGRANAVPPPPLTEQQKHQLELQQAHPQLRCKNCIGCFREKNCGKCFTCASNDGRCCMSRICVQVEELLKQQQKLAQKTPASANAADVKQREAEDGENAQQKEGRQQTDGGEEAPTEKRRGSKKKGRKPKTEKQWHCQNQPTATARQRKYHRHGHGAMTAEEQQQATNALLRKAYDNLMKRRQSANGGCGTDGRGDGIVEDLHCRGPGCTNSARVGSKYCSENCGIELAKLRLRSILPQRFNAFFGDAPPHTQTKDNAHIEHIQEQMADINIKLDELEQWKNNVHQFMVAVKSNSKCNTAEEQQKPATKTTDVTMDGENDDGDEANNERRDKKPSTTARNEDENVVQLFGCPVCHGEFQMRDICKHVHTCFVRSERQTTYGTDYQIPNNQYNLYCEAFNKIDGTYCKRLRYACAEHYRDAYGLEMCACPLSWYKGGALEFREMFVTSSQQQRQEQQQEDEVLSLSFGDGGFCREKHKNCRDHKNWAQTAFSLIDNERLNLLNKFDELCEQRRHLQLKLLQRGDILSLICNSTEASSSTTH